MVGIVFIPVSSNSHSKTITEQKTSTDDIYQAINENFTRAINEMVKYQPQYMQSLSNLQIDYIQALKNIVENAISVQKQIVDAKWNSTPFPVTQYLEHGFAEQLKGFTNNIINITIIGNEVMVNILNATRDNLGVYNKALYLASEYHTNTIKLWNSFFDIIQQYNR